MEKFTDASLFWIREPRQVVIEDDKIEIITEPFTDLWQRTYYGFQNDNAPVLQMKTDDPFFSFVVKTTFDSSHRFDQCGIVIYLDSENWLKASVEYENDDFQRLGSVVTNQGFSDWATTDISTDHREVWYRLSRRQSDYCIDYSFDGVLFKQMRICHLNQGDATISFGIYACSPEESSFTASFEALTITDCKWAPHS
ncbi:MULTISPECIES: DUF1349 domain-containing protein [Streptococcaceae]|jgi:regulation of enolase protein 1 (concanavalin A-like superfamily)|uniref:Protein of hypothetical function DUF1349 n=1 Tax=Pseudolactococcus piscium MKFS47 TaxID=297352 RepID=A0A0D6DZW4_9LACT|nr:MULTISPECIES: DUF1349 domain-containing protein [Lactococcus]MBR6895084.1 DUF1349 domain-containing protein [Lactococcus sp.]MCJ1971527.1 DUF1349 domain-containing protein [Lactococcus carnosus]MDN5402977.1 DUF1349 domain-containing protein [Lactococcus sp.]MDN5435374.1 DUF1349 domain-containing protein [Lactococcus sp.]MDN5465201.1 DUF1349 domain-containing protein [Lactococcus sp.]